MKRKLRILLVEDDQVDQLAFKRFVERENLPYDYVVAGSVSEARDALAATQFDAALIDYLLGDGTAFDLFDEVRDTPIVVVTGSGDEEIAVQAMRAGAYDYMVKDLEGNYLKTLPVTVENALSRRRAEEELGRYREHLEELVEERTAELVKANEQLSSEIAERKLAEKELYRYAERLRTLRAIDGAILAAWSPEETARAALRHMRQLVPCWRASVVMLDREDQAATVLATYANGQTSVGAGARLSLEEIGRLEELQQSQVHVEDDILARPQPSRVVQALQAEGLRSYVTVPLIAQGELIGYLNLGANIPAAFTPEHVDIAREVADQVSVALHQARLRAALETEEQRLEALVEHLPEGILLLNDERRLLLSNPAAQTCLPILTDGAIGDVLTLMADRPVEELLEPPPEGLWHELEVPGPPRRVFEVAAQPMEAGLRAGGWVLVVRDVTEEQEVQERIQQQERLAAVGQLAGGIAHDFNNLLTTIMLYAQMPLSKRDLPPDLTRALETIISESRQAAKLVQQILDFGRRSPIETHPVDLKPFIEEAVRILERTIPESISLLLEVGPSEYVINADPTRIQQVLMNLVVNARDAMPKGGVLRITLSRAEVRPGKEPPVAEMVPGEWVCLTVSDTGTGMSEDALAHLFEPFFTTKEPGKGTGLGLAQVYGIVKQHEGHIGVETEAGQGTTFRVYLPAHKVEEGEEIPREGANLAIQKGHGETILLVEDNKRIREVSRRILESLGYRVLAAANGKEALEIYRTVERACPGPRPEPFGFAQDRPVEGARPEPVEGQGQKIDLVLTDVVMPEMSGRELIQELRKTNPGLKALITTGYTLAEDLQELKEEGILDVVHKPFDMSILAEVIHRILDVEG